MKQRISHFIGYILIIFATIFSSLGFTPVSSHAATSVNASAAIAIDAKSGQILYAKNANQRLAVASMSKLLTVAVIEHEIDSGHLKWTDKVKISKAEAKLSTASGYSNVPLQSGKKYTIKQLTEAALIKSGDAATIALSRAQGKSTKEFVKQMGTMAQEIGLKNYRLYNGVGLENKDMASFKLAGTSGTAENEMTATDVAKIARYLISNYPDILKITKQSTLKWDGQTYQNGNELLPGSANATKKVVVDGLKTGTSDKAGQCLASTGTYKGHRIITVVMHASDRFTQTKAVYTQVFTNWKAKTQKQGLRVTVSRGQAKTVRVQTKQAKTIWQPKSGSIKPTLIANKKYKDNQGGIKAPLETTDRVGKIQYRGLNSINGHPMQFGVYPNKEVNRSGLIGWLETIF